MASRPFLLLGNIACIILTIVAFLQLLSWTITGLLILVTLTLTSIVPWSVFKTSTSVPPISKKQATHQPASSEAMHQQKSRPEQEHLKIVLRPSKQESLGAVVTKTGLGKPESLKTVTSKTAPAKIAPPGLQPSNAPIIAKDDYNSYDIELEEGREITAEVTASGPVNVYLLNQQNLTSLDLGEEFWSETCEEGVQKATLNFTAPEKGKWFLVVENAGTREVSATVNIQKDPARTRLDPFGVGSASLSLDKLTSEHQR